MTEAGLEPLITECPECDTRFRVTPGQLDVAQGKVRCGVCQTVFLAAESLFIGETLEAAEPMDDDALDDLLDELEPVEDPISEGIGADLRNRLKVAALNAQSFNVQFGEKQVSGNKLLQEESEALGFIGSQNRVVLTEVQPEKKPEKKLEKKPEEKLEMNIAEEWVAAHLTGAEDEQLKFSGKHLSEESSDSEDAPIEHPHIDVQLPDLLPSNERSASLFVRPLTVMLGLVLLSTQILWFQFDSWALNPELRPLYQNICKVAGCVLPARRSLNDLIAKNVVIRPHTEDSSLLVVDAIIVNKAAFPQRFPLIDMRFSSLSGMLVQGRKFSPEDYLSGDALGMHDIQPNAPVHVTFEMVDPGPEGSNYVLSLL